MGHEGLCGRLVIFLGLFEGRPFCGDQRREKRVGAPPLLLLGGAGGGGGEKRLDQRRDDVRRVPALERGGQERAAEPAQRRCALQEVDGRGCDTAVHINRLPAKDTGKKNPGQIVKHVSA